MLTRSVLSGRELVKGLKIGSPKRSARSLGDWEGFFPYYAGFPEAFAQCLLRSAKLPTDSVVLDPWNGSGTTTHAASQLGLSSRGCDINPVMVVVARARMLAPSEADSLRPLASSIVARLPKKVGAISQDDPLNLWFVPETAWLIRQFEKAIRRAVVGELTVSESGVRLEHISGTAATLYVALFSLCRDLASSFKSSNPTWIKIPKATETKIKVSRADIVKKFNENVHGMVAALLNWMKNAAKYNNDWTISQSDTTNISIDSNSVDFILTSPPYCTRIDYAAATRVELAVLNPLLTGTPEELARKMIGSTRVPKKKLIPSMFWGETCGTFIDKLRNHRSKASSGYYLQTHLDYFSKMYSSLNQIVGVMKTGGVSVMVIQDSYYKNIHNDLPAIISEMACNIGFEIARSERFSWSQSMSRINPHTKIYGRPSIAIESVLCFVKQ